MINITDLMLEAERLHARAYAQRAPVDPGRLAILTGAELVSKNSVRQLLPDADAIMGLITGIEESGKPGVILVDTGMATRDAIILVNACQATIAGRALVALALAHSAQEPARRPMTQAMSRMVVITLPDACERTIGDITVFHAGTAIRHDPSGASIGFRPMAEAGIQRLALSLLITEKEIHTTAEWIGTGTEEGREERVSAMMAMRAGVPVDWIEKGVQRHMNSVLHSQSKPRKKAV